MRARLLALLALVFLVTPAQAGAQSVTPAQAGAQSVTPAQAGAQSVTPAQAGAQSPPDFRLPRTAAPISYELRLAIDPRAERFEGEARIALRFDSATPILWLNATALEVESAELEQAGTQVPLRVIPGGEDFVGFESTGQAFQAGEAVLHARYRGSLEPLATRGLFRQKEGGGWYVVSQFEAMSARRAFPCFDEPGWKVPFQLTIDAPEADVVVSNTPEAEAAQPAPRAGWRRHTFARTRPLPTYLVALAVGPFDVVDGGRAGRNATRLRYFTPRGRGAEVRFAKEVTPALLERLEEYFGMPYPYEKLDSVTIPATVGFGAMENVGMITYAADILLARPQDESLRFRARYASFAAHEIAHQWFGNYVTPAWWDDIWLNEAFATWMARKTVRAWRPEWDTGWNAQWGRRRAITADRLASARRVRNPVLGKDDVYGAFDGITYNKGGEVLSMFEALYGAGRFRQGVRDYLASHAWGNATSGDFFRAIARAAGRGEAGVAAFEAFVDQPGLPLIDVSLRCGQGGAAVATHQQRFVAKGSSAPAMRWRTPACFRHGAASASDVHCTEASEERRESALGGSRCPDWLVGNAGGSGHWIARYDAALARRNVRHVARIPQHEAMALAFDMSILEGAGLMPTQQALLFAGGLLGHPSTGAVHGAVHFLDALRREWLTPAQSRTLDEMVRGRIQPLARDLGWREREADGDAVRELREQLLPYAAREAGGEALRAQARELALAWIDGRGSIDGMMLQAVLDTTARFADAATYERLQSALLGRTHHLERFRLLTALAKVREPALRERALSLALRAEGGQAGLDGREAFELLKAALLERSNQGAAFAWVREHWEPVVAKLPPDAPGRLARELSGLCTPAARDEFIAFFGREAPRFRGGAKHYAESLEAIRVCVAVRGGG